MPNKECHNKKNDETTYIASSQPVPPYRAIQSHPNCCKYESYGKQFRKIRTAHIGKLLRSLCSFLIAALKYLSLVDLKYALLHDRLYYRINDVKQDKAYHSVKRLKVSRYIHIHH